MQAGKAMRKKVLFLVRKSIHPRCFSLLFREEAHQGFSPMLEHLHHEDLHRLPIEEIPYQRAGQHHLKEFRKFHHESFLLEGMDLHIMNPGSIPYQIPYRVDSSLNPLFLLVSLRNWRSNIQIHHPQIDTTLMMREIKS